MTNAAVQKEAFLLASRLTIVYSLTLAKPSIHLAKSSAEWLSKTVIGNLTKPDIGSADLRVSNPDAQTTPINSGLLNPLENLLLSPPYLRREILNLCGTKRLAQNSLRVVQNLTSKFSTFTNSTRTRAEGFSNITTRGGLFATVRACARRLEGFSVVTMRGGKFAECIKKGGTPYIENVINCLGTELSLGQSFGFLHCSLLSLRSQASSTQAEKLALGETSFSRTTLASIFSIKSCGKRIPFMLDLLFMFLVATDLSPIRCSSTIHKNKENITLDVLEHLYVWCYNTLSTGKAQVVNKITKPSSGGTLAGLLATTVNASNEEAVMKHTTHPKGRHLITQNSGDAPQSFVWIIAAVRRDCPTIRPTLHHIPAATEHEARRTLAVEHVCFFAGRLVIPRTGLMDCLTPSHASDHLIQEVNRA